MAVAQRMTEHEYERFILSGVSGQWELHDGRLVEKPGMSWEQSDVAAFFGHLLQIQLDRGEYRVFIEGRTRNPVGSVLMPDVLVVPAEYGEAFRGRPGTLAIFSQPLPLIVEIWSISTGD
jgi:Uma2 family endonuclease